MNAQIAAEAADRIFGKLDEARLKWATTIIQSAIEKATVERDKLLSEIRELMPNATMKDLKDRIDAIQSRAAHASKPTKRRKKLRRKAYVERPVGGMFR